MGRLFGTDGARGVANAELTCELAMNIGKAAAMVLTDETHKRPMVLIGKDTRMSSDMLESALAAGLCSVGADVCSLGVVPTPAVAYLVRYYGADAGVMISASHNPCEFNGIKIFNSQGYKLSDALEEEIENIVIDNAKPYNLKIGGDVGKVTVAPNAAQDYIDSVKKTVQENFDGLKIAIDCANGSSSVTAKNLFEALGAQVILLSASPNGVNINANCGSTHMDNLRNFVVNNNLDIGLAFDGDADRFLAVDELGNMVDGDQLIAICAKHLKAEGKLNFDTAVVTVMSNLGFFKFCEREGIKTAKTKVGDRYVLEEMLKHRYTIGGEQSGHIIFHDYATTGDGQLTAVQLLSILKKTGKTLSRLAAEMTKYPQTMINVRVSAIGKARFDDDEEIKLAIQTGQKELGDNGRILVRVSGTEPLIRVMVEGIDKEQITRIASEIAEVVRERLIEPIHKYFIRGVFVRNFTDSWDYELLDTSDGERLERWGEFILIRPDPQVIWKSEKKHPFWRQAHARYHRSKTGGGHWEYYRSVAQDWSVSRGDLTFRIKPMNFKHTGLFPEQAVNWDLLRQMVEQDRTKKDRQIKVLNLFAYTGAATVAALKAGAAVTHVDASKGMVSWAKENAASSGVLDAPVRWLVDDCLKFIQREQRRGNRYDGIILDPPSYGRGPGGEVWQLEEALFGFLQECAKLLDRDSGFVILNSYTTGLSASVMEYLLRVVLVPQLGGRVYSDEIGIPVSHTDLILPCGATCIWRNDNQ